MLKRNRVVLKRRRKRDLTHNFTHVNSSLPLFRKEVKNSHDILDLKVEGSQPNEMNREIKLGFQSFIPIEKTLKMSH